ncbi:hypothetical protein B566_EDAN013100 [Ephemera danica]|nr:hypothetical protein B566_EDAN013100 [Ephemera danica]
MEWQDEKQLVYLILGFQLLEYVWELYLSLRQHAMYSSHERVPSELTGKLSEATFTKARLYGQDKSSFGIVKGAYSTVLGTTAGFYIKDRIKKFLVSQAITLPLIAAIVWIVHWGGELFFLYLWLFTTVVILLLMTVYPDYIAPLFDKYTPLPEGELRSAIEKLAQSIGFPLYKLYVVEGSKRSVHSNAYFYGFFKNKRIVLFDTLLADYSKPAEESEEKLLEKESEEKLLEKDGEKSAEEEKPAEEKKGCSNEEVLAVLAHELGHWQLNHINLFLMFAAFGFMVQYEPMYRAFGFYSEKPVLVGMVIVLQYFFAPYNALLGFLLTMLSRRFEFQADAFAVKLGRAEQLGAALIKLNKDNLDFPIYDWLYSSWHHSHPTLLQRLDVLRKHK